MKAQKMEAKIAEVKKIEEKLDKVKSVVIVDYRGISVTADTQLRAEMRKENVEYKVIKNRVVLRALNEKGFTGMDKTLEGPSAFAFSYDDPVVAAKIISDKAKDTKISIKGGIVEGKILDAEQMKAVAAIPPKNTLIAQFLGLLQSPIRSFAVAISEIAKKQAEQQ